MSTRKLVELSVQVPARPGELTRVMQAASKGGVNILAFYGYNANPNEAFIRLVPDNEDKAKKALEEAGLSPKVSHVVAVTGEAGKGAGVKLCQKLSESGINIEYAYASTPGTGSSTVIFKVSDADAALRVLKT